MIKLNVKIAGEAFTIEALTELVASQFKPYLTDTEGGAIITPTQQDLESMHEKLLNQKDDRKRISPTIIEFFVIHELIAREMINRGVLLVHGSAVVADGNAHLFIAPSGTGKSTHTKLWLSLLGDRAFIINDDKQLIRITDAGAVVYPTPWGQISVADAGASAPLKSITVLYRGKNNINKITEAQMFPELFKASLRGETPMETLEIINLQKKLMSKVGLYKMTCEPTVEAAETAYKAIADN